MIKTDRPGLRGKLDRQLQSGMSATNQGYERSGDEKVKISQIQR
jgi:hypothetical protein